MTEMDEVELVEIPEVDLAKFINSNDSNDSDVNNVDDEVLFSSEIEKIDPNDDRDFFYTSYHSTIEENPLLTKDEEDLLFSILVNTNIQKEKEKARSKLIKSNLKLVLKEAIFYSKKSVVPREDLINSGIEGLCMAIDKFDPERNIRLSTYATPWIKCMIFDLINNYSSSVYIPENIINKAIKYNKMDDNKSEEEIMKELEVSKKEFDRIKLARNKDMSIDAEINNGNNDMALKDVIPDENSVSPEEGILMAELSEILIKEVNKLDPMAIEIIKMRYLSEDKFNLAEIGKKFDVTGEYIRQIESRSIKTLKSRMKKYCLFGEK